MKNKGTYTVEKHSVNGGDYIITHIDVHRGNDPLCKIKMQADRDTEYAAFYAMDVYPTDFRSWFDLSDQEFQDLTRFVRELRKRLVNLPVYNGQNRVCDLYRTLIALRDMGYTEAYQ